MNTGYFSNSKFESAILHNPHLLCELFNGIPDLCGVDACLHFSLPDFLLVKIFCTHFSAQNIRVLKIGKAVLGIGKTAVSTISRRSKRSFPSPSLRHH